MRNPRRTAGAATALMIGVAVVTLFTVFTASIQASVQRSVDTSFGGDLAVTSGGFTGGRLDPALAAAIGRLPQVGQSVGIGTGTMLVDGASKEISVADPAKLAGVMDLEASHGSIATLGAQQLAVSKSVADGKGWKLGSVVPVRFADGAGAGLTVGAIFDAQGTTVGDYLVPRAAWTPHSVRDADGTVLVKLRPGTSLAAGRAAVERVTPAYGDPKVQDRAQYADTVSSGVSGFLTVVYVLLALAILIALMGIANTMSLSIHERTRELGLLRAVGQTRRQARAMVRWESVIVAMFGTAGGLGLGVFLGWALVRAVSPAGIGAFAAPLPRLALILLVGALAGVLAGLRPARRAARLDVLTAIATE